MNENGNNGFVNNPNMNNMNNMNQMNGINNMSGMNNQYTQKENNLGKISLIMAYASWMLCCFGPLLSVPAFIMAIVALVKNSNESKLFPILAILGSAISIVLSTFYIILMIISYVE